MSNSQARRRIVVSFAAGLMLFAARAAAAQEPAPRAAQVAAPRAPAAPPSHRPAALVPLYLSFGALQVIDVQSTLAALGHGGREANPIVGSVVGTRAGLFALKAGTAAGTVLLTERLWKRNRTAAVVTMLALDSAYAVVTAHNYAVAR